MSKILVVDDESNVLASFEKMLAGQGHEVVTARRAEAALTLLEAERPELLIMDIRLPGLNGLEAFRRIRSSHPRLPVIIMTGYGTTESAIEATKLGAFDYQVKPFEPDDLLRVIDRALEGVRLMQRQVEIDPGTPPASGDALIGQSAGMQEVYKAIGRVAQTDATVLIRGETGTGKELVARAIYQHSLRSAAPLLMVNCVAIPETLLESELFGYEKGAFTGAASRRIGKFEQADGGTILLDEIGDIPLGIQAKILRVLQERSFERIGGNDTIRADVRVLAATNRNLERAISEGKFREDLYHRLNVVTISIPPLRERREDIPRLADYFLERFAGQLKIDRPPLSGDALEALRMHPWPGNVRELEHCIHRAMIFTRGYPIQADDVRRALERPAEGLAGSPAPEEDALRDLVQAYLKTHSGASIHGQFLEMADRLLVAEALRLTGGNQTHAARLLGLTRPTLQAKMQKYGIRRETHIREG
ncbi:MAG: Fis family transcriptional regulator [Candidatus Handelsmanbacteria bacterium RIFCSPLOWO2_12_FULL_64_10]|uniref:DNA-binding transcriptional regulator NtrC n=1 Tax=Handelsmanbacteria sp. (strain RIFCSPLOWO2_12_FULL_64_10) TaxID=1817868 RepID=A0A1F6D3N3_HANXR|nr:MAG: Fis family transcriptional regulator [Candidatus Handelsmanbacteria bacterium RIFCSPLOWO2_12_FULL_64_10]